MVKVTNGFDIAGWLETAHSVEADLHQLATALTEAQFHAPPRDGGWSVGYCIEHLVLTGHAFLPKWDAALNQAGRSECRLQAAYPYLWWQRTILRYTEDPSKLKSKTSPSFVPYSRHSIEETVGRFLSMHQEFVRRVTCSRGLDLKRTKVQSPFVSWLKYALGFSFDLVLAHERRHLCQAWQVRRQLAGA
jgi:DinB family protein